MDKPDKRRLINRSIEAISEAVVRGCNLRIKVFELSAPEIKREKNKYLQTINSQAREEM